MPHRTCLSSLNTMCMAERSLENIVEDILPAKNRQKPEATGALAPDDEMLTFV